MKKPKELTAKVDCPHLHRYITISSNPLKNECERCYEKYIQEKTTTRLA